MMVEMGMVVDVVVLLDYQHHVSQRRSHVNHHYRHGNESRVADSHSHHSQRIRTVEETNHEMKMVTRIVVGGGVVVGEITQPSIFAIRHGVKNHRNWSEIVIVVHSQPQHYYWYSPFDGGKDGRMVVVEVVRLVVVALPLLLSWMNHQLLYQHHHYRNGHDDGDFFLLLRK